MERTQDDLTLLREIAAGQAWALEALYARVGPALLSYLVAWLSDRQQAEEVLQDVMLAVWDHARNFRNESSVYTWLLVIARNRAMNAQRRYHPDSVPLDDRETFPSPDTGPQEAAEKRATASTVRKAIAELPDHQREVLVLTFYHHLSGQEIADMLGISLGTVKSRLNRAKEALRHLLQSYGAAGLQTGSVI
jgi:RNA polymerase sigma-70 factor (ECF subfamily)